LSDEEETMSNRLLYFALALSVLSWTANAANGNSPPQKPNIIFILSDDVGLGDVHCTGGPFNTPNID